MAEEDFRNWEKLCELIWSCAISQAIHVFVEMGIPEMLAFEPKSLDQLAIGVGADVWSLETVLRALVVFDILSFDIEQRYTLTSIGRFLLKAAPGPSAGEAGEFFETLYRPLGALSHMVKTGDVAFDHIYGKSFYEFLEERPMLASHFYSSMEAAASQRYASLSSIFDFSQVCQIVDVGGGEGSLLVQILRENPHLRGVLFDLPLVSERAYAKVAAAGLSDRCEVVSGNFFSSIPCRGDLFILAQVLNNWRDLEARRVLVNCHSAMKGDAQLLVLEPVYPSAFPSRWRTLVSLGVMAQRGGRTRTEPQLRCLISAGGFHVDNIVQLPSNATCMIKARPVI
jgi:O-methyltransferase